MSISDLKDRRDLAKQFLEVIKGSEDKRIGITSLPGAKKKDGTSYPNYNGVFDSIPAAIDAIFEHERMKFDEKPQFFPFVNKLNPDTVEVTNGFVRGMSIKQNQIDAITVLCVDIDPPDNCPRPVERSTLNECIDAAKFIDLKMREKHYPSALITSSGNGAQMFYKCGEVEYLPEEAEEDLGHVFLRFMQLHSANPRHGFDFDVTVDVSVGNAVRIMRLPGTRNWKKRNREGKDIVFRTADIVTDMKHFNAQPIHPDMVSLLREWGNENPSHKKKTFFGELKAAPITEKDYEEAEARCSYETRIKRAIKYVKSWDPEGEGNRSNTVFSTSGQFLTRGLLIRIDDAAKIMHEHWNVRNKSPLPFGGPGIQSGLWYHTYRSAMHGKNVMMLGSEIGELSTKEIEDEAKRLAGWNEEAARKLSIEALCHADMEVENLIKHTSELADKDLIRSESRGTYFEKCAMTPDMIWAPGGKSNVLNLFTEFCMGAKGDMPAGSLLASLSLFSQLLSKKYSTPIFERLKGNLDLWNCHIARSGTGKSFPVKKIYKAVKGAGCEYMIGGETIVSKKSALNKLVMSPGHGVLFPIDEAGDFFRGLREGGAGYQKAITTFLKATYSVDDYCDDMSNEEFKAQKGKKKVSIKVDRPCLGIHASMTPGQFKDLFDDRDKESGMANRWLFLYDLIMLVEDEIVTDPNRNGGCFEEALVPSKVIDFMKLIPEKSELPEGSKLQEYDKETGAIKEPEGEDITPYFNVADVIVCDFSELAHSVACNVRMFENKIRKRLDITRSYVRENSLGRYYQNIVKIASISAICQSKNLKKVIISEDDMRWAANIVNRSVATFWSIDSESSSVSSNERYYDELISELEKRFSLMSEEERIYKGGLTKRDLVRNSRMCASLKKTRVSHGVTQLDSVIDMALANGDIVEVSKGDQIKRIRVRGEEAPKRITERYLPTYKDRNDPMLDMMISKRF